MSNNVVLNRVAEYRKKQGLTQKELAELAGLGLSTIKRIESGSNKIRIDRAMRVADALNVDIHEVFYLSVKDTE